jgi:hypothetical protein
MRKPRARPGMTLGVIDEDGLDAAYEAAGEALDALAQDRGPVWESGAGRARRQVTENITQELFASKDASTVLSAYRHIVEIGQGLAAELINAEQTQREDWLDLAYRASSWCNRCIDWANDPKAALTQTQRMDFRAAPAAPTTRNALAVAVGANVSALEAMRELIEQ